MTIPEQARLARSARLLKHVTVAAVALVVPATLFAAWAAATGFGLDGAVSLQIDNEGLAPLAAALNVVVIGVLLIIALLQLVAMLRSVEQGAPFRSAPRLRAFAFYLFLSVLAAILMPPLLQLAEGLVTARPRRVAMSLSGDDVMMLFVTGLLFFVARLLEEAQRVADEHGQIV